MGIYSSNDSWGPPRSPGAQRALSHGRRAGSACPAPHLTGRVFTLRKWWPAPASAQSQLGALDRKDRPGSPKARITGQVFLGLRWDRGGLQHTCPTYPYQTLRRAWLTGLLLIEPKGRSFEVASNPGNETRAGPKHLWPLWAPSS